MLPFVKHDKRRWKCFVCGREHTEFTAFKEHIIEKHDEGREYVICPIKRCGCPVRDVRLHCKAKHSGEKIPQNGPMKALIWKDQKGNKLKTRKPKFREGYMVSLKNNGKEMHYKSGLECEFYECLEVIPEVLQYDVEPIAVPYFFEGKSHQYYPDLSINFVNGEVEIWEIKPASQSTLPINEAKWKAAEIYCKKRGWKFITVHEEHLQKLKKRIRQMRSS